jgi:hypothetical protein
VKLEAEAGAARLRPGGRAASVEHQRRGVTWALAAQLSFRDVGRT